MGLPRREVRTSFHPVTEAEIRRIPSGLCRSYRADRADFEVHATTRSLLPNPTTHRDAANDSVGRGLSGVCYTVASSFARRP